jgi:ABC-type Zn2+ transport system substrate-binding protein/surface adhesin
MDRLVEAVAEYLCRHRSVGLLRLTLDLTRRRLDLFAEVGAVEVVKGSVAPPTPGTATWWRAAAREAVYTLRERGLVQYVREAEVVSWTGPTC